MRRYATDLALKLGTELPDFNNYKETKEWIAQMRLCIGASSRKNSSNAGINTAGKISHILQGYCADIKTLFTMRKGEDCKREIALFLYRLFIYHTTDDKELALTKTLELNASFSCPFSNTYVINATKSAERKIDKGDMYNYKRDTIVDILDITAEEMKQLVYLTDAECRKERKKERNKKYYQEQLAKEGRETKRESMAKRRDVTHASRICP